MESTGGDVELEFLPPYTPQLNPVETVWRDLKKRLAGRFFRSLDELKAAITAILEREMGNRLKGYLASIIKPACKNTRLCTLAYDSRPFQHVIQKN